MAQHGAYWLLMLHYYHDRALPADRADIHELCLAATDEEREMVDGILEK